MKLTLQKRYGKNFMILSSTVFCMIHPSDGQRERQTDGRAIAYSALSICYRVLIKRHLWISQTSQWIRSIDITNP